MGLQSAAYTTLCPPRRCDLAASAIWQTLVPPALFLSPTDSEAPRVLSQRHLRLCLIACHCYLAKFKSPAFSAHQPCQGHPWCCRRRRICSRGSAGSPAVATWRTSIPRRSLLRQLYQGHPGCCQGRSVCSRGSAGSPAVATWRTSVPRRSPLCQPYREHPGCCRPRRGGIRGSAGSPAVAAHSAPCQSHGRAHHQPAPINIVSLDW